MNTAWWKSIEELDDDQRGFVKLPASGRHLLVGPPGSGKTNLLLLRTIFLAGSGFKNVLIVTYTNALSAFIRSGIARKELVTDHQVSTFHKWAYSHISQFLGRGRLDEIDGLDTVIGRETLGRLLTEANRHTQSKYLYDAIFVDEAQDLMVTELQPLLQLSANVCVCGDLRQSVYRINNQKMDGLGIAQSAALSTHTLKMHYRIGPAIAQVADRILIPENPTHSLDATTNYNKGKYGDSTAKLTNCLSHQEQFNALLERVRVELVAFKGDIIGIICPRVESIEELRGFFEDTDLKNLVVYHGADSNTFGEELPIHVMSVHSSKGTEFRAVHIYRAEDFKFPLHYRELVYTAVTRAKTALNVYYTGDILKYIESAFAQKKLIELTELFGGTQ